MNTRSHTRAAAHVNNVASLLGKRWLLLLQRQAPPTRNGNYALNALECDIILRLWDVTWSDTRTRVILDEYYTVDDWMARIVIYVIKFFGTSYGPNDRALLRWIRGNIWTEAEDEQEWLEREIQTVNILSPFVLNLFDVDADAENVAPAW